MLVTLKEGRGALYPPESRESGKLRLSEIRLARIEARCLHFARAQYRNDNRVQRPILITTRRAGSGGYVIERGVGGCAQGVKREPSVAARKLLPYIGLQIKRMPGVI